MSYCFESLPQGSIIITSRMGSEDVRPAKALVLAGDITEVFARSDCCTSRPYDKADQISSFFLGYKQGKEEPIEQQQWLVME